MSNNFLMYLPVILAPLCFISLYILMEKIHNQKVHKELLKWAEQHSYELIDFNLDRGHTGPFMFDIPDNLFANKYNTKHVYIVNYKDRNNKISSGYILYGASGLNLSGNNIVFEPIEDDK